MRKSAEGSHDGGRRELAVGLGWSASLQQAARGATVRLRHPAGRTLFVEITVGADGPVIRASAAALHIDAATDIVARCERFAIDARQRVSIRAPEIAVRATAGDVSIHANDDVQLLGEQVLLNCQRDRPLPEWLVGAPNLDATTAGGDGR